MKRFLTVEQNAILRYIVSEMQHPRTRQAMELVRTISLTNEETVIQYKDDYREDFRWKIPGLTEVGILNIVNYLRSIRSVGFDAILNPNITKVFVTEAWVAIRVEGNIEDCFFEIAPF